MGSEQEIRERALAKNIGFLQRIEEPKMGECYSCARASDSLTYLVELLTERGQEFYLCEECGSKIESLFKKEIEEYERSQSEGE